ncbi:MAG: asparagine synthase (glutamine-hydrolyzing) [Pyrinomonadaceae bacterium]
MCGIAGIVGLENRQEAAKKIRDMSRSLDHRGPDADGHFVADGVALGHRRLSIIDLSEAANQPMFDPTGRFAIILNGEIYNYKEVKSGVPDYPYSTESDTEAILAAYIKHGPACLSLLNGMFAFAVWDAERREVFAARDRLGVKPFYYSVTAEGVFVFASEIRAILSSGLVPRKIDPHGLYDYVMYQSVYAPRTIVEGISQLPAGNYAIFADGDLRIKPYWRIEAAAGDTLDESEADVRKKVRSLLLDSVEMRMISDVRLGAFLSGGIDSSTVVGLMSEVSAEPVETFSVTFAEKQFDESRYSGLVAKRFNTRHTSIELTAEDFLAQLPEGLSCMDSPSGDGLNTFVVSRATRDAGIKVALSGIGGDEVFAGYRTFKLWAKLRSSALKYLPASVRSAAGAVAAFSGQSRRQRLGDVLAAPTFDLADVYPMFRQVLSQRSVTRLCKSNGHKSGIQAALDERANEVGEFPILSQFSIAELLGYTQNVLLKDTDQFSMASALEVREPFLDYKLIEYVLRIPDEIKFPAYPKRLLVESVAPLLPDEIVHRKKMGFVLPWQQWMRGELREFCRTRIDALGARGIVDGAHIERLWSSFEAGSGGVLWSHLWHLVVLEDWLEANEF